MIGFWLGLVRDINGAAVSFVTLTIRVLVPIFPPSSVAVYVIVYTPSTVGFTAATATAVPPPSGVLVIVVTMDSPVSETALYSVYD